MNACTPRIAYFLDSLLEVNGVAHTSRYFECSEAARNHALTASWDSVLEGVYFAYGADLAHLLTMSH